ncbi:uncharacterized protein LOC135094155 [Scylla paramamosain]|uniref:uncharacterized protein LOC135094155 n=1 Tax=Scylla paramamosain TaxID=85552 RepID=UPI0030839851
MRNARKLKGSEIYIDEDLCPASQEIRKSQIPLMKKARKEGKIPFFRHTRLIIKDKSTKYQLQGRSSGSEGVSTREAVGDVTGAVHQASEASGGESSVDAEGGNNYASTRGAVGHVSEAVVQTNEASGGESSVGGEGGSTGGPYSALTGSSGVGGGSGSCHGRPTPSGTGGGDGPPDAAPTQRQQQTSRTRNRRKSIPPNDNDRVTLVTLHKCSTSRTGPHIQEKKMRFSRGEVVFYRLKIRSKTTNVAEVNEEKVEEGRCQKRSPTWGHLWSPSQVETPRPV